MVSWRMLRVWCRKHKWQVIGVLFILYVILRLHNSSDHNEDASSDNSGPGRELQQTAENDGRKGADFIHKKELFEKKHSRLKNHRMKSLGSSKQTNDHLEKLDKVSECDLLTIYNNSLKQLPIQPLQNIDLIGRMTKQCQCPSRALELVIRKPHSSTYYQVNQTVLGKQKLLMCTVHFIKSLESGKNYKIAIGEDIYLPAVSPNIPFPIKGSRDVFVLECLVERAVHFGNLPRRQALLPEDVVINPTRKERYEHLFVQVVKQQDARGSTLIRKKAGNSTKDQVKQKQLNVMVVSVSSLSYNEFTAFLPRTLSILKTTFRSNIFTGYTSMGSDDEIVAITGLSKDEVKRNVFDGEGNKLETKNNSLVWQEYRDRGYVPIWAADMPAESELECHISGCGKMDHHLQPLWLVAESTQNQRHQPTRAHCIGSSKRRQIHANYVKQFNDVYRTYPTFAYVSYKNLFECNVTLSKEEEEDKKYVQLQIFDKQLNQLIRSLQKGNHLENTVLIVTSSSQTTNTNTPSFLSIFVPKLLLDNNRRLRDNLHMNTQRMVTPYDVHHTLRDILNVKAMKYNSTTSVITGMKGTSLFQEIASRRTCETSGIGVEYCPC